MSLGVLSLALLAWTAGQTPEAERVGLAHAQRHHRVAAQRVVVVD